MSEAPLLPRAAPVAGSAKSRRRRRSCTCCRAVCTMAARVATGYFYLLGGVAIVAIAAGGYLRLVFAVTLNTSVADGGTAAALALWFGAIALGSMIVLVRPPCVCLCVAVQSVR